MQIDLVNFYSHPNSLLVGYGGHQIKG